MPVPGSVRQRFSLLGAEMAATPKIASEASGRRWLTIVVCGSLGAALAGLNPSLGAGVVALIFLLTVATYRLVYGLLVLVVMAPWASLTNVLTDGRLVALGLDCFVIAVTFVAAFVLLSDRYRLESSVLLAIAGTGVTVLVGFIGMFNPKGLPLLGGMEGFRAFFLPIFGLPLGVFITRRQPQFGTHLGTAVLVAALAVALMGIRQALTLWPVDLAIIDFSQSGLLPFEITGTNRLRAFSPLPGPFHFGFLMMIAVTIAVASILERPRKPLALVMPLFATAMILNATRLNWLGAGVAIVASVGLSLKPARLIRWTGRLALLALVAAPLVWYLIQAPSMAPVRDLGRSLVNPWTTTSFVYRVLGWQHDVLPAIRASPLIGYGTGMAKDGLGPFTSHSLFFKVQLEGGALLLAAYLLTVCASVFALVRRHDVLIARLGLALTAGVLAAGTFGPVLDAYPGNLYFWLLIGSALGCDQSVKGVDSLASAAGRSDRG